MRDSEQTLTSRSMAANLAIPHTPTPTLRGPGNSNPKPKLCQLLHRSHHMLRDSDNTMPTRCQPFSIQPGTQQRLRPHAAQAAGAEQFEHEHGLMRLSIAALEELLG